MDAPMTTSSAEKAKNPKDKSVQAEASTAPEPSATRGSLNDYLDLMERGDRARFDGDYMAAIEMYLQASEMRPNMFQPYMLMGQLLHRLGLRMEALDAFKKAYELQSDNAQVMTYIAEIVFQAGDAEGAKGILCDALMANDRYVPAICALSDLLAREEQYDKAIDLLSPAIEELPTDAELWVALGTVMHAKGDLENARTFYEEGLRIDPENNVARHNLDRIGDGTKTQSASS